MSETYLVKQGDCISTIAESKGFFWEDIWNHDRNAALRAKRANPNVLRAGDEVFIPDNAPRQEPCVTGQTHLFRLKSVPVYLRFKLVDDGFLPRPGVRYTLRVDGVQMTGTSKADGMIEHVIDPQARSATLTIDDAGADGADGEREEYQFDLGHLDPVEQAGGLQARLRNLGYLPGEITGHMDAATRAALESFQHDHDLPATGEPDEQTRQALQTAHES